MFVSTLDNTTQTLRIVTLHIGEIYCDLTDKKLYMLMCVNEKQQTCRFLTLKTKKLYCEMCYEGLQLQQVT
jgi:hypothetical protein